MLSILDPVLDRHPLDRGRTLMSALAALLLVVPLAALQPYPAGAAVVGRRDPRRLGTSDEPEPGVRVSHATSP